MGPFVSATAPVPPRLLPACFYGSGMLLAGLATAIDSVPYFISVTALSAVLVWAWVIFLPLALW